MDFLKMNEVYDTFSQDLEEVKSWMDSQYSKRFESFFLNQRTLRDRMKKISCPITDEELEVILTSVPLNLIDASEELNRLRLEVEVIKSDIKSRERKYYKEYVEAGMSATESKAEAASSVESFKIFLAAYESLVTRVENEISCTKELIMGAKKIWDGHRASEVANPIGSVKPVSSDVSDDYYFPSRKN